MALTPLQVILGRKVSFEEFTQSIGSHALRQIAGHWRSAGGGRLAPSWSDIKPGPIACHLPIIWSLKFDPNERQFTGRLAGEEIVRALGKNFRGQLLKDVHPSQTLPWVHALCLRVVSEPACFYGSGRICKQGDKYGAGERLLLPLSSGGDSCDGILGATQYDLNAVNPDLPIEPVDEGGLWYVLKPS